MPANLFPTDPDENAASLSNLAEVLFGCLDAIAARTVVEVGAFHGKSTNEMLAWAERAGAKVIAVDPAPQPDLTEIAAGHPELELVEATSHDALPKLPVADAIIIDGDHNYFTLSEELRLISKRDTGATMPLLMFHDIGWPLARRDGYYAPDRIPAEHRQPLAFNTFLAPEEPGTLDEGMPFACVAEREGGPATGSSPRSRTSSPPRRSSSSRRSRRFSASASSGIATLPGRRRSPQRSLLGTAIRCSSGSRPTGFATWSSAIG